MVLVVCIFVCPDVNSQSSAQSIALYTTDSIYAATQCPCLQTPGTDAYTSLQALQLALSLAAVLVQLLTVWLSVLLKFVTVSRTVREVRCVQAEYAEQQHLLNFTASAAVLSEPECLRSIESQQSPGSFLRAVSASEQPLPTIPDAPEVSPLALPAAPPQPPAPLAQQQASGSKSLGQKMMSFFASRRLPEPQQLGRPELAGAGALPADEEASFVLQPHLDPEDDEMQPSGSGKGSGLLASFKEGGFLASFKGLVVKERKAPFIGNKKWKPESPWRQR